jgi:hypothetical protein
MEARNLIDAFAEQLGWTPQTCVDVLCAYINNQQDGACLHSFLQQQAEEEESYTDEADEEPPLMDEPSSVTGVYHRVGCTRVGATLSHYKVGGPTCEDCGVTGPEAACSRKREEV